jgi:hypothetical protein
MSDLDDAIRDHLELKRRRGADPAEVARQEQEALAPVTRSHPIVVMSPSTDSERELAPVVAAANGSAPHDEDLSDATQEFHVEQSEDWLAAEEG